MVTVKTFPDRVQAELARQLLKEHGIESSVFADDQGGLYPSMAFAMGVDLKVHEDDRVEAQKILITQESQP